MSQRLQSIPVAFVDVVVFRMVDDKRWDHRCQTSMEVRAYSPAVKARRIRILPGILMYPHTYNAYHLLCIRKMTHETSVFETLMPLVSTQEQHKTHPQQEIMSTPPPPLDDPTVSDPLQCPELRWGLIGCGRVSHDFTQALKHLPTQKVVACSARSSDSAKTFAEKHGIANHYGSYDEMLTNPDVQIVYVGNVHAFRRETGEKCLMANKNVLLEKPFACTVADGEYLMGLAKERNLFIMEGMWTRFFPAVQKARNLMLGTDTEEPVIGEISKVYTDFNFYAPDHEEYPSSFVYNRKLGGGASLLVAPYPIAAATLCFKNPPDSAKVVGQVDEGTGVDIQGAMVLSFPPSSKDHDGKSPKLPGAGIATLSFGMMCETPEETAVIGNKGRLTIETPSHCPTKLSVSVKAHGRGQVGKEEVYEYPLPEDTEEIKAAGGYFYPNSAGFIYEAAAVARCIAAGKTEVPQFTHEETLLSLKLVEEIRSQLGVKPVDEE